MWCTAQKLSLSSQNYNRDLYLVRVQFYFKNLVIFRFVRLNRSIFNYSYSSCSSISSELSSYPGLQLRVHVAGSPKNEVEGPFLSK